jgi:cytochrome c heme-lyase
MGYKPPFDRHDWVVERCGKEVSYLIDFYQGRQSGGKPVAMHIDARPAADDLSGAWQRVRMQFQRLTGGAPTVPQLHPAARPRPGE